MFWKNLVFAASISASAATLTRSASKARASVTAIET